MNRASRLFSHSLQIDVKVHRSVIKFYFFNDVEYEQRGSLILKISENKVQSKEICDIYSSSNKTFKTIKNIGI
jgi:hypothetical protein